MSVLKRVARVTLLIGVTIVAAIWGVGRVNATRDLYEVDKARPAVALLDEKDASQQMLEQSKMFETWTVALLGGLMAIIFTSEARRIRRADWWYIIAGPAAALLVCSLNASWVFRKRYTFLVLTSRLHEYNTLMRLLQDQIDIFQAALGVTIVFGAVFLFGIVLGTVESSKGT